MLRLHAVPGRCMCLCLFELVPLISLRVTSTFSNSGEHCAHILLNYIVHFKAA